MILVVLALACASRSPAPPQAAAAPPAAVSAPAWQDAAAVAGVDDPVLARILDDHWEARKQASPEWATGLGDHRFDHLLSQRTPEARAAWAVTRDVLLARAVALDGAALSDRDRVTLALFQEALRTDAADEVCAFETWTVGVRFNAVSRANWLHQDFPAPTPQHGAALLSRYRALPTAVDQEIADLRRGLSQGRVADRESLSRAIALVEGELAREVAELELLAPTRLPLSDWPPDAADAFRSDLTAVVRDQVRPAFARYLAFLRDELLPAARGPDAAGLHALPDGAACYAAQVRRYTTLDRTPADVHQRGLDALASIHAEIRAVGADALGTDDLAAILVRLRTDPALRFQTSEQVVATAEDALARAQAALPQVVDRATPDTPCDVEAMPEYEAAWSTIAYYRPPTEGRGGTYVVNATSPDTRPRHEAEVLAFHEAVPGHHLQIAAAREQSALPAFRRHLGLTAFVEGWALYSERVADEVGLYSGPLDRLGMLSFDTWRAARLVVDTGIHDQGWTRQQAIDFMLANTPLAPDNIDNEVDRYISWPGQALGYKTGQQEILALRAQARDALGDRFRRQDFHDLLLTGGAVTLPLLRQRVAAWVAAGGGPPGP